MGELELRGRVMPASNATFVGELDGVTVVYKPVLGEKPLWDFPDGTLADREVAAHAVSVATGWDVVPRTWMGDGPHGPGMLQEWQEPDPGQDAVTLVRSGEVPEGMLAVFEGLDDHDREVTLVHEDDAALRRMAVFDVIINNADRKGGHILAGVDGGVYGVDHGVSFHTEDKLRTVLWGWAGKPVDDEMLSGVAQLADALRGELADELRCHITAAEVAALRTRTLGLLDDPVMPGPDRRRPIPWPAF